MRHSPSPTLDPASSAPNTIPLRFKPISRSWIIFYRTAPAIRFGGFIRPDTDINTVTDYSNSSQTKTIIALSRTHRVNFVTCAGDITNPAGHIGDKVLIRRDKNAKGFSASNRRHQNAPYLAPIGMSYVENIDHANRRRLGIKQRWRIEDCHQFCPAGSCRLSLKRPQSRQKYECENAYDARCSRANYQAFRQIHSHGRSPQIRG
jgi:hypothetical protein